MRLTARVFLVSVFVFGLLAGVACAAELAKDQHLAIAFDAGDLKSLDPHRAAATADRAIVDMMFNGLVRYPPGNQVKLRAGHRRVLDRIRGQEGLDLQAAQGGLLPPLRGQPRLRAHRGRCRFLAQARRQ